MPKQTFFNLPDDKRNQIIDLAIDEFADHDYPQASISRVVERAGIAKGSFYQYFEDKKDLYLYLLDLAAQEKLRLLEGLEPADADMGLFDYLRHLFRGSLHFQFARPRLAQMAYRALYGDSPLRSETMQQLHQSASEYYRQLVARGKAQGDIDPQVDDDLAAFVLSSIFNEFGNYLMTRIDLDLAALVDHPIAPEQVEAMLPVVDDLLRILERGLASREPVAGVQ